VQRFHRTQRAPSRKAQVHKGKRHQPASASSANEQPSATAELALAQKAWEWTVAREEILVGRNRSWNRFSLDEVLALPEEQAQPPPGGDEGHELDPRLPKPRAVAWTARAADKKAPSKPTTRPRISVTEKTQWLTITGHDVDYKKIPRLEFACLGKMAPLDVPQRASSLSSPSHLSREEMR